MYDLLIIGAGPAGMALARRSAGGWIRCRAGAYCWKTGPTHSWAIRQFYPEQKLTTANYKGYAAQCEGLLCITDMTKSETLAFFDQVIEQYNLNLSYGEEVYAMRRIDEPAGNHFRIESTKGTYETKMLAIAIGILGAAKQAEGICSAAISERQGALRYYFAADREPGSARRRWWRYCPPNTSCTYISRVIGSLFPTEELNSNE